jgi:hypothetical protein
MPHLIQEEIPKRTEADGTTSTEPHVFDFRQKVSPSRNPVRGLLAPTVRVLAAANWCSSRRPAWLGNCRQFF